MVRRNHSLKGGTHLLNELLAELANKRGGLTDADLDGRHVENKAGGRITLFAALQRPQSRAANLVPGPRKARAVLVPSHVGKPGRAQ